MAIKYFLAPNARWQGRTLTGQPCVNGKLYTYRNLTVTPKATYQDYQGNTPNTNPVILDGKGEANIYWANDEFYSIVLEDANGNVVYSQDYYPDVDAAATPTDSAFFIPNMVRNPQFTNWTNSTSYPNISKSVNDYDYVSDEWYFKRNDLTSTINITRGVNTLGDSTGPYFWSYDCTSAGSTETFKYLEQKYNSVTTLQDHYVNVAFEARSSNNAQVDVVLAQYFGAGGSPSPEVENPVISQVLTNNFVRYQKVIKLASITGKTLGTDGSDALCLRFKLPLNSPKQVDIRNVQLQPCDAETEDLAFPYISQNDQFRQSDSQVTNALYKTGDFRCTLRASADAGWVMCDDGTIGDSSSGSGHSGLFTKALFKLIWTNITSQASGTTYTPIYNSDGSPGVVGASAEADYNAHKRLSMTRNLGRLIASVGNGHVLGEFGGADTSNALIQHSHSITNQPIAGNVNIAITTTGNFDNTVGAGGNSPSRGNITPALNGTVTGATDNAGSGSSFDIRQPTFYGNVMLKF